MLDKALTVVGMRSVQPPPPSSHERTGIVGDSPTMRQVYATLERAAQGTAIKATTAARNGRLRGTIASILD